MITLCPPPAISMNIAYKQKNKQPGRKRPLTSKQITLEAQRVVDGGLSSQAWRALDLLATGGVLDLNRLGVTDRTMRNWSHSFLVDRLQTDRIELQAKYDEIGLTGLSTYLYALGPVGREIATQRHGESLPGIYHGWPLDRILHDLVANEVIFRLAEVFGAQGWNVEWMGAHECALIDTKSQTMLLTPGGLLRCHREDGQSKAFLLEYHNEGWSSRAAITVERYERAVSESNWREQWEVETFPPVLAVFHKAIVGAGYKTAIQNSRKSDCAYYGKTLSAVLDGKLEEWTNISEGMDKEEILPK